MEEKKRPSHIVHLDGGQDGEHAGKHIVEEGDHAKGVVDGLEKKGRREERRERGFIMMSDK